MGFLETGGAVNVNPERIDDGLGGSLELKLGTVKVGLLPAKEEKEEEGREVLVVDILLG